MLLLRLGGMFKYFIFSIDKVGFGNGAEDHCLMEMKAKQW